jgi:hypothetical protein
MQALTTKKLTPLGKALHSRTQWFFYFMEQEIWLPVVGYEGYYDISNMGNIRSLYRTVKRKNGTTLNIPFKTKSVKTAKSGYAYVHLDKDGIRKFCSVHRLVAKAFLPNTENKKCVNHINSVRDDNRVVNLEWVTPTENMQHAIRVGSMDFVGEKHPNAKLTNKDVAEIFKLYKTGKYTQSYIGKLYGVSFSCVSAIVRGAKWTQVTNQLLPSPL